MPEITANAPDGTKHVFPDGTDPTVIDRVMKQYITGSSDTGTQPDQATFQRQARGTNPALTKWASEHPQEAEESRQGVTRGAWENLGNLAEGVVGAGKEILFPEGKTEGAKLKDIFNKLILQPALEEEQKAGQTQGIESAGHTLASYIPMLGPMAASAGESFGRRDVGGGLVTGGASLLGARGMGELDPGLKAKVTDAGKMIQRHLAIDSGKVRVVNDMVRKPLAMLDSKVNEEIGKSVNNVVSADEMDMQAKSNQVGFVDVSKAAGAARDFMQKTGKALPEGAESQILRAESRPMIPLREAKSFTTDVGRIAAGLERSGDMRGAGALNALYDGLHDATGARAKELGGPQAKLWQHYIDETRNYKGMQGGLLGELVDEPVHAKALSKLIDPQRATEASEISKALQKYGIDPSTFDKAKELGTNLDRYSKETQANFMGKIKAIIKHPVAAGGAAVGASIVGGATGLPGMALVLPIIVAGKVANLLDAASMKSLLKEIAASTPPEAGQVRPPLEGPMAPSGTPPSPTGGGWKGGINPRGVEASQKPVSLADQIAGLRTQNLRMKEQMRTAGEGVFSEEEIQQAEQRQQENANIIKELQAKLKG
jgi:hypothetical protein